MPRNIPDWLKDGIAEGATQEGLYLAAHIEWDDGVNVGELRLVVSDADVVSNGETFMAASFDVQFPDEDDSDVPKCVLMLDDVDLSIRTEIVKLQKYATIRVLCLRVANPDQIGYQFYGKLRIIDLDEPTAAAEIHLRDDKSTKPYPAFRFSRAFGYMAIR